MRRLNPDVLIAICLLILCAELFRQTFHLRVPIFATMSSAIWPRFILVILACLSLIYLVQSLHRAVEPPAAARDGSGRGALAAHRNAVVCFGLFALFLLTLPWLGMLLGGIAFVFLMQELTGPRDFRSRLLHMAVAIVSVGGMWAVFTFALRVILPQGALLPGF